MIKKAIIVHAILLLVSPILWATNEEELTKRIIALEQRMDNIENKIQTVKLAKCTAECKCGINCPCDPCNCGKSDNDKKA